MKTKKILALVLLIFIISSNFSAMVLAQPPTFFKIAYTSEGLKTEDGKYKFWIVVEPAIEGYHVSLQIPYRLKNGVIEEVNRVYPSSFGISSTHIEVSGPSVVYLTVSGSSPSLELSPGTDYYLTSVTRPEDLISTLLYGTLAAIYNKFEPLRKAVDKLINRFENTRIQTSVIEEGKEVFTMYMPQPTFVESLPAQDELLLVSLRGDKFRDLSGLSLREVKNWDEGVILYVPPEEFGRRRNIGYVLDYLKSELGNKINTDYVLVLDSDSLPNIAKVTGDGTTVEIVGYRGVDPTDLEYLHRDWIDSENARIKISTDPELSQEIDAALDMTDQLKANELKSILQSLKENIFGEIKEKINAREILSIFKRKLENVVDYLATKYTAFKAAHPNAIRYAKIVLFVSYLIVTLAITFFPQYFPDWFLTAYSIITFAVMVYDIALTAYAVLTGTFTASTVISIIGWAIAIAIAIYGSYRATLCEGKLRIQASKYKAGPGETISIMVSGFQGDGCIRKGVFLYKENPNDVLTEPLSVNLNPSDTVLTLQLPTEPGKYTYWVAARVSGGKYYLENELDSFIVRCEINECSIFLGETYYGDCSGSATPCEQLNINECSKQKGCKIESVEIVSEEEYRPSVTTFKCSGEVASCNSFYHKSECEAQKGCSWITKTPEDLKPVCQVTPDKTEITGRESVTFTIKTSGNLLKYGEQQEKNVHYKYEEITGFLVSCGDEVTWSVIKSDGETTFTCPYRAFSKETTLKPYVKVCSASGCGTALNSICTTEITTHPAEATETKGNCYGTFIDSEEEIKSPKLKARADQGTKVAFVTKVLFIGEDVADAYGEVSVEKPRQLKDRKFSYYVCKLEPTEEELKEILPQTETVEYNERTVVKNGQYTTIQFGVEETVNVVSPLIITFTTDKKSECRIVEEEAVGGYGIHPTKVEVTSDEEGKTHRATLVFGETGAVWQLLLVCSSQDENGKTFVSTTKLPRFIITSLKPETKVIRDDKGNVIGSAAVFGDTEITTSIKITRINVQNCQIWPVQGCLWGPAGQAYVHSNRDAYIEVITQRSGKGPYFVRFYSEGSLLHEEILGDPPYLLAVPQTSSFLRIPITKDTTIRIDVGFFVEVEGKKVEILQDSATITLKIAAENEPCEPGITRRCDGNNISVCVDGTNWKVEKECEYGCEYGSSGPHCKDKEGATGSCYLGANPDRNMAEGGTSTITVVYANLPEEPGSVKIDCGNGETKTATNCRGTSGTCSAQCRYSGCSPSQIYYSVSASASGKVCEGATIWCSDSPSGIQPEGISLSLSVNGPTPMYVGDKVWLALVACRGYPCVGSVAGIPVTLYVNDNPTVTETTTSAGITWERTFTQADNYKFYAKFGDIKSNTLEFVINEMPSCQSTNVDTSKKYTLSVTKVGEGSIFTPTSSPISLPANYEIEVTCNPASGWIFDHFEVDGSGNSGYVKTVGGLPVHAICINMDKDHNVKCVFKQEAQTGGLISGGSYTNLWNILRDILGI